MTDPTYTETISRPVVAPEEMLTKLGTDRLTGIKHTARRRIHWHKVTTFGVSIFLFIMAIALMKEGAGSLAPLVSDTRLISTPTSSLGFGWLFAYVIMSGSPGAAVALAFFDTGLIDMPGAFTMIMGSRLGAGFIVLLVGFMYLLRGRDRATSLEMGLLSLTVTGSTCLISLLIGPPILHAGILGQFQLRSGMLLNPVTDLILDPVVGLFANILPRWSLFLVGLVIITVSFRLFDKSLPQVMINDDRFGCASHLVYRPWGMFLLGAGITLVSMSVSISLSLLVPLNDRGLVRREKAIPYIMGANITTFVDTLLAAILLNNTAAFTVVFVSMVSITVVSAIILATAYCRYEQAMLTFVNWITARDRNLIAFTVVILIAPVILLLL